MGLIALGSASVLAGASSFSVAETALSLSPSANPFAASHSVLSCSNFLSSASVGLGSPKGPSLVRLIRSRALTSSSLAVLSASFS